MSADPPSRRIRSGSGVWIQILPKFSGDLWSNFHEDSISSFYVKLLTDKQTGKCRAKCYFHIGGNYTVLLKQYKQLPGDSAND